MARLYANENVPFPTVAELRSLGHEVLTSLDASMANQGYPDDLALKFAHGHDRILLTNDRLDFRRLHAGQQMHVGIIEFTNDADFTALARRIDAVLQDEAAVGRFYASVTQGGYTLRQ